MSQSMKGIVRRRLRLSVRSSWGECEAASGVAGQIGQVAANKCVVPELRCEDRDQAQLDGRPLPKTDAPLPNRPRPGPHGLHIEKTRLLKRFFTQQLFDIRRCPLDKE